MKSKTKKLWIKIILPILYFLFVAFVISTLPLYMHNYDKQKSMYAGSRVFCSECGGLFIDKYPNSEPKHNNKSSKREHISECPLCGKSIMETGLILKIDSQCTNCNTEILYNPQHICLHCGTSAEDSFIKFTDYYSSADEYVYYSHNKTKNMVSSAISAYILIVVILIFITIILVSVTISELQLKKYRTTSN